MVLNRKASIRVLEKLEKTKGNGHVLTRTMDMGELGPIQKTVTVGSRLAEMRESLEIDEIRLAAFDEMIAEEIEEERKPKAEVEHS